MGFSPKPSGLAGFNLGIFGVVKPPCGFFIPIAVPLGFTWGCLALGSDGLGFLEPPLGLTILEPVPARGNPPKVLCGIYPTSLATCRPYCQPTSPNWEAAFTSADSPKVGNQIGMVATMWEITGAIAAAAQCRAKADM